MHELIHCSSTRDKFAKLFCQGYQAILIRTAMNEWLVNASFLRQKFTNNFETKIQCVEFLAFNCSRLAVEQEILHQSGVQLPDKLASLDIMGAQLKAPLKPLKHLDCMVKRGHQLSSHYAERFQPLGQPMYRFSSLVTLIINICLIN